MYENIWGTRQFMSSPLNLQAYLGYKFMPLPFYRIHLIYVWREELRLYGLLTTADATSVWARSEPESTRIVVPSSITVPLPLLYTWSWLHKLVKSHVDSLRLYYRPIIYKKKTIVTTCPGYVEWSYILSDADDVCDFSFTCRNSSGSYSAHCHRCCHSSCKEAETQVQQFLYFFLSFTIFVSIIITKISKYLPLPR